MKYPQYTLGLVTGFCLGCLYFMIPPFIDSFRAKPVEAVPTSNFTVIEKYKGCDVVRYTPDQSARYTYFLDCKNE